MVYSPDLRPSPDGRSFTVGYLDAAHPFTTGAVPPELIERLAAFQRKPAIITFGFHTCTLCGNALSSTEICVATEDGRFYIAPWMIGHYITEHGYCPPAEFIAAVLDTPLWQGEPIVLTEEFPKVVWYAQKMHRGHLSPRYIAVRYKRPGLLADPRWSEGWADKPLMKLLDEAKFASREAQQMLDLLSDPQYDA